MSGSSRITTLKNASTGNDLVSLEATRPERTILPRFYSRILTPAEKEGYRVLKPVGLEFDQYVWLCWSVKESVYKFKKRQSPELSFAPLRITIDRIDPAPATGIYNCEVDGHLYARVVILDGVIATTVSEDPAFSGTHWGVSCIDSPAYADQSAAVRALVLDKLKTLLSREDLQIKKNTAGCPIVLAGDKMLDIPVSLAHHHRHIAYSFYLPE